MITKLEEVKTLCKDREYKKAETLLLSIQKEFNKNRDFFFLLENIYQMNGKINSAIETLEVAIKKFPSDEYFHNKLSFFYNENKMEEKSIDLLEDFIKRNSSTPEISNTLGICYTSKERYKDAIKQFEASISLNENFFVAYNNLADVYIKLEEYDKALLHINQCLKINPSYTLASQNKYKIESLSQEYSSSIETLEELYKKKQASSDDLFILCILYSKLKKKSFSKSILKEALEQHKDIDSANYYCSIIYYNLGENEKCMEYIEKIKHIKKYRISSLLKLHSCLANLSQWNNLDKISKEIKKETDEITSEITSPPTEFEVFTSIDSVEDYYKLIALTNTSYTNKKLPYKNKTNKSDKIKVGYISSDLSNHPVALLIEDVFKHHNLEHFKTYIFPTVEYNTKQYHNICNMFEKKITLSLNKPRESAERIYKENLDILIDLTGPTEKSCYDILSYNPCNIQAHMIGHTGTLGVPFINYLITTPFISQPKHSKFFYENLLYLPDTDFSPAGFEIPIEQTPTRRELNIPEDAFIFLCHHQAYRMDKKLVDSWFKIVKNVKNGVLWIYNSTPYIKPQILEYAKIQNISLDKVKFYSSQKLTSSWFHVNADLFLDTFNITSGTCAFISLWTGLPVLTLAQDSPKTRVAGCYCQASGVPEQITYSINEYIEKAIFWGNNSNKITTIKRKLLKNRITSKLFNSSDYIKNLEEGYKLIIEHHKNRSKKKEIYVN